WGAVTRASTDLYANVYSWPPAGSSLHLTITSPFQVTSANVLGSSQPVSVVRSGDGFDIRPSGGPTNSIAMVIHLKIAPQRRSAPGTGTGLTAQYFPNS